MMEPENLKLIDQNVANQWSDPISYDKYSL